MACTVTDSCQFNGEYCICPICLDSSMQGCLQVFCYAAECMQIAFVADSVQVDMIRVCQMPTGHALVCYNGSSSWVQLQFAVNHVHPVDHVQRCTLQGNIPSLQQALELHSILTQSDTNLRQPVALKEHLLRGRMGSDVAQSMLQMLQVSYGTYVFSCLSSDAALQGLTSAWIAVYCT